MRPIHMLSAAAGMLGIAVLVTHAAEAQNPTPIPSVWLQSGSPGTKQTGNSNINGTAISGHLRVDNAGTFAALSGATTGYGLQNGTQGYYSDYFTVPGGSFTMSLGTSGADGGGYVEMYMPGLGQMALIEADIDNTNNGIAAGGLMVRSAGSGGPGGQILVRNNSGNSTYEILGGGSGASATVALRNDVGTIVHSMSEFFGNGGAMSLRDENSILITRLEPDAIGTGSWMALSKGGNETGFLFDGNTVSGNPFFAIYGTGISAAFDFATTGNPSVVFPNNAISSTETFDEAGTANIRATVATPGTLMAPITSRSITVPTSGYVIAWANADLQFQHTNGTQSYVQYGLSTTNNSLPTDQDIDNVLPPALPTGTYNVAASAHGLFAVNAGTTTIYFNARRFIGSIDFFDINLTLLFVPTAYGTTVSNFAEPGGGDENEPSLPNQGGKSRGPLTIDEILYEQSQAAEFDKRRQRQELEQMKAQLKALEAKINASIAKQNAASKPIPKSTWQPKKNN